MSARVPSISIMGPLALLAPVHRPFLPHILTTLCACTSQGHQRLYLRQEITPFLTSSTPSAPLLLSDPYNTLSHVQQPSLHQGFQYWMWFFANGAWLMSTEETPSQKDFTQWDETFPGTLPIFKTRLFGC